MSYTFLDQDGHTALLFDEEAGVVIRVPIVDRTGLDRRARAVPRSPRPRNTVPVPYYPGDEDELDAELPPEPPAEAPPAAPRKRTRSIMPPEMRGIFLPQDHPQAAKEVRRV